MRKCHKETAEFSLNGGQRRTLEKVWNQRTFPFILKLTVEAGHGSMEGEADQEFKACLEYLSIY